MLTRTIAAVLTLCASGTLAYAAGDVEFFSSSDVGTSMPSPVDALDAALGERPVRHAELVDYAKALADASPRVTYSSYGRTHEGRELFYLTVTSEENHRRLEAIREANLDLADPRRLDADADVDALINDQPAIDRGICP
ncbi:MAG: hypothetical protein AAF432_14730 [Planctomycetota bacterium]